MDVQASSSDHPVAMLGGSQDGIMMPLTASSQAINVFTGQCDGEPSAFAQHLPAGTDGAHPDAGTGKALLMIGLSRCSIPSVDESLGPRFQKLHIAPQFQHHHKAGADHQSSTLSWRVARKGRRR